MVHNLILSTAAMAAVRISLRRGTAKTLNIYIIKLAPPPGTTGPFFGTRLFPVMIVNAKAIVAVAPMPLLRPLAVPLVVTLLWQWYQS